MTEFLTRSLRESPSTVQRKLISSDSTRHLILSTATGSCGHRVRCRLVESGHATVVRLMAMGRLQTNCTQNIFTLIIKKKIYTLFDFRCVQVPFLSPRHVKFPAQDAGATLHPETCRESPATRSPAGHNAHPCSRGCNVYHHLPCVSAGWDRCQCWLTGKEFLKILPIVPGKVCQLHIALSFIIMILIRAFTS